MKNEDTRKAVKSKRLNAMNDRTFYSIFSLLTLPYSKRQNISKDETRKMNSFCIKKKSFSQSQNLIAQSLSILEIKSPTIK